MKRKKTQNEQDASGKIFLPEKITFRVSEKEKQALKERARIKRMTVSVYCRESIIHGKPELITKQDAGISPQIKAQIRSKFDTMYNTVARMSKTVETGISKLEDGGDSSVILPSIDRTMRSILAELTQMNENLSFIEKKPKKKMPAPKRAVSASDGVVETLTLDL